MGESAALKKRRLSLTFDAREQESSYRDYLALRNVENCRLGWGLMLVLCLIFTAFDRLVFGDKSAQVLMLRIAMIAVGAAAIILSFSERNRRFSHLNSVFFIASVGSFCLGLLFLVSDSYFALYFTGLFFAFAGVFLNPGISNTFNLIAMVAICAFFLFLFGVLKQISGTMLLLFSGFLVSIVPVFGYAGYLVERNIRHNYLVSDQLRASLREVRTLTGLLPICSKCKKIRDDRGYWSQIELYLSSHANVDFTHGYCPDCAQEMIKELGQYGNGRD